MLNQKLLLSAAIFVTLSLTACQGPDESSTTAGQPAPAASATPPAPEMSDMMEAARQQAAQMTPEQRAALLSQTRKAAEDAAREEGFADDLVKQAGDAAEAMLKQSLGIE